MAQYALVIDYKYCTGCHTCEVACRKEKGLPTEEWGLKLSEQGPVEIAGKWMWNYLPIPSDACDCCVDRLAEGDDPYCVHHCLAQCMSVVPVVEVGAAIANLGSDVCVFVR